MLNTQNLLNKICNKISEGGLTSLQTCQTTNSLNFLSNTVISVATVNDLPLANSYTGRLIYVTGEKKYYYSVDGLTWTNDFSSKCSRIAFVLQSFGLNTTGQLGDNTLTSKISPVSVVNQFLDWCQVSTGGDHNLAIRSNGTIWAWGLATSGQLGTNNTTNRSSPVSVVGGFTDWCQISAGTNHSLAVRTNGTAWSWGCNSCGQLGDNTIVCRSSPVSVVGGFTDWNQISSGLAHNLGVRTNGTIWAWGNGGNGRLGDNSTTNRSSPVSVIGGFTDWCQISAGREHSVALRTNGSAWSWGRNYCGGLGDGTVTERSSPVSVVGGFTDWCQVAAGFAHSLAVRTNGTAWSWGCNSCGQLGDNTIVCRSSPVSVVGGFTNWCQVSAGFTRFSLGIRSNGTAWSWGYNNFGILGDGTSTTRCSPISVVGGFTTWCQLSAGKSCHNTGLLARNKGF